MTRHERDIMNVYIASSRNGLDWDISSIYSLEPCIERGPPGSFYKDGVYVMDGGFLTHENGHSLFFNGYRERHEHLSLHAHPKQASRMVGLASFELNRIAYIQTLSDSPGALVTKPFILKCRKLMLNLKLARDREGVPLEVRIIVNASTSGLESSTGSELIGRISGTVDSVSSPVVWGAEIFENRMTTEEHQIPEEWIGREVVTVFHMPPEAQVYALQFTGCDPLATMAAF